MFENAIRRKGSPCKYCMVVTLDERNAFNSDNWVIIWKYLATVAILTYVPAIVDSFLGGKKFSDDIMNLRVSHMAPY